MTQEMPETPSPRDSDEETLLGDPDDVQHPPIEEQVDEKLEQEKEDADA